MEKKKVLIQYPNWDFVPENVSKQALEIVNLLFYVYGELDEEMDFDEDHTREENILGIWDALERDADLEESLSRLHSAVKSNLAEEFGICYEVPYDSN
jgi:heme oxygenase